MSKDCLLKFCYKGKNYEAYYEIDESQSPPVLTNISVIEEGSSKGIDLVLFPELDNLVWAACVLHHSLEKTIERIGKL